MARATMDITFQCPGKNVRPSIKIFFFSKKELFLIKDLHYIFPIEFFFCSLDIHLFVALLDFFEGKNATLFISAMGKIYYSTYILISNWIYRQMSKLISNHETYTKLIFCERLMCGTIYTFAQKLNDKREKLPKRDILFRNKRFMLDEMTQRSTWKFAIFYVYKNPKLLFPFFISFHAMLLYFFP